MQSIKELKYQARVNLHGHWKEATLLNMIPKLLKISIIMFFTVFFIMFVIATPSKKLLNSFERVH